MAKVVLFCTMLVSTWSIQAQVNSQSSHEDKFIADLIQVAKRSDLPTVNGRYVIAKQEFCKEQDCNEVFKAYKDILYFYSTEDMFMRKIKDYIIIENYNEREDSGSFGIMKNGKYKVIAN